MKLYKSISLLTVLLFIGFQIGTAQNKKEQSVTMKVWGNCGMCKKTIEKTALANGASTASWNSETKMLDVQFASNKTSTEKIQQAIALVGYDTEKFTANQQAYDNLHECCKYERKSANEAVATAQHGMQHAGCEMKDGACKKDCCKDGKSGAAKKEAQACKKDGSCCKDGKCEMGKAACKDAAQCKEKGCCKS